MRLRIIIDKPRKAIPKIPHSIVCLAAAKLLGSPLDMRNFIPPQKNITVRATNAKGTDRVMSVWMISCNFSGPGAHVIVLLWAANTWDTNIPISVLNGVRIRNSYFITEPHKKITADF